MQADLVQDKVIQSFNHPLEMFGYTSHALMIPPFPPSSMLMLGYGYGNVSVLTKRIWGDQVRVFGVDSNREIDLTGCPDDVLICNADDFVRTCEQGYDYVCIDLYNGKEIPDFVFFDEFISKLSMITNKILSINCTFRDLKDFSSYEKYFKLDCVKIVNQDHVLFFVPKKFFEQREKENKIVVV